MFITSKGSTADFWPGRYSLEPLALVYQKLKPNPTRKALLIYIYNHPGSLAQMKDNLIHLGPESSSGQ